MDYNKHKEEIDRATQLWECGDITRENLEYIFPELCESDDEKIRNVIRGWIYTQPASFFDNGISKKEMLDWLENQGEQKPANKVKPKFNVGDWIVFNGLTLYVKEVVKGFYRTITIDGISNSYDWDIDNIARLWTIADAKDGDVLVGSYGIFIFMNKSNGYCGILSDNTFIRSTGNNEWTEGLHPATKEQRDLLFKKMKDIGYEFDFNKKELKIIDWSKHIKYEPNSPSITKEKPVNWSEEDEKMITRIIEALQRYMPTDELWEEQEMVAWLEKQGEKYKWTQNDEQYLLVCKNALRKYQVSNKWDADIISKWLDDKLKQNQLNNQ